MSLGGVLWLTACAVLPPPPGSESLGAYTLEAIPVSELPDGGVGSVLPDGGLECALPEVNPATFRFDAIVTRDPGTGEAFVTLGGGYHREAQWDGQVVTTLRSARRLFPSCRGCPETMASERMTFALMSQSQSEAVGRRCPPNPLDGGIPPPPGPDGGVSGPGQTPQGFDALYVCGTMTFSVSFVDPAAVSENCNQACATCVVRYGLVGERR